LRIRSRAVTSEVLLITPPTKRIMPRVICSAVGLDGHPWRQLQPASAARRRARAWCDVARRIVSVVPKRFSRMASA
jgi:hypothetical protein